MNGYQTVAMLGLEVGHRGRADRYRRQRNRALLALIVAAAAIVGMGVRLAAARHDACDTCAENARRAP